MNQAHTTTQPSVYFHLACCVLWQHGRAMRGLIQLGLGIVSFFNANTWILVPIQIQYVFWYLTLSVNTFFYNEKTNNMTISPAILQGIWNLVNNTNAPTCVSVAISNECLVFTAWLFWKALLFYNKLTNLKTSYHKVGVGCCSICTSW